MSSSRDKRGRQPGLAEGMDKKQKAALEEEKKRRKSRRTYTIVGVLLVLFIVFVTSINSNLFYNKLSAVDIGDDKYVTADYSYYYVNGFNYFYNQVSGYVSIYGLDITKPFNEQPCMLLEDGGTWADYFRDTTMTTLKSVTAQYAAAVAAGYTLSEEERTEIDTFFDTYTLYAGMYGTSLNKYLAANFGKGTTEKSMRALLERAALAGRYVEELQASYTYSEDELDTHYEEIRNTPSYESIEYLEVFVDGAPPHEHEEGEEHVEGDDASTEEEKQAAISAAKETAEKIAAAKSEEEFLALAEELNGDVGLTTTSGYAENFPAVYADWLGDTGRRAGETYAVDATSGYYALYYVGRQDNHYNTASVRHILIKAVDVDGDSEYSEEELATAKARAEELYAEWQASAATEDSFAEMANESSEDAGSNTTGGLYENISKGQMVPEFDAFCFEGHKNGDTGIVRGETSEYAGYHIIYFVGEGDLFSRELSLADLRSKDFLAWNEAETAKYAVKEHPFVLRLADTEVRQVIYNMMRNAAA